MSVVEFKLGIRGKTDLPRRNSEAWCRHIDQIVRADHGASADSEDAEQTAKVAGLSFSCDTVKAGSMESLICGDKVLSALDRKLADVYVAAFKKAVNEHPPLLKAEQRGWVKGRNECWKATNKRGCVRDEYVRRIAELQARYRLGC
jgi:uncharacterized protein YecT (DUF1311 family)